MPKPQYAAFHKTDAVIWQSCQVNYSLRPFQIAEGMRVAMLQNAGCMVQGIPKDPLFIIGTVTELKGGLMTVTWENPPPGVGISITGGVDHLAGFCLPEAWWPKPPKCGHCGAWTDDKGRAYDA